MTRLSKNNFNQNQSIVPVAELSGAGLIQPLNNNHTANWAEYTYGITICTDTNTGNEYVYRTVKTSDTQKVYYKLYSTSFYDALLLREGGYFMLRDGGHLALSRTNLIPVETYIITQPMFTISGGLNADYTAGEWKYNGGLYSIESGTTELLDDKTNWHIYLESKIQES